MIKVGYGGNFKFTTSSSFDAHGFPLSSATRKPQLKVSLSLESAAAFRMLKRNKENIKPVSVFMFELRFSHRRQFLSHFLIWLFFYEIRIFFLPV